MPISANLIVKLRADSGKKNKNKNISFTCALLPSSHGKVPPLRAKRCKNKHQASLERLDKLARFNHLICTGQTSVLSASPMAACTTYRSEKKNVTKNRNITGKFRLIISITKVTHHSQNLLGYLELIVLVNSSN